MTWKLGGQVGGIDFSYEGSVPSIGSTSASKPAGSSTGYPFTPCPGQPTEAAAFLLDRITQGDSNYLSSLAPNTDAAAAIASKDAPRLAYHVAGGNDCQVTSGAGRAFTAAFDALVQQYGGAYAPTQTGTGSVWDVVKTGVIDPLAGTVRNVGESAITGATTAAQGAQAGSSVTQLLPLLLVLGLAALVLVPVLRRG